jgi:hypothetical protein
MRFLRDWDVMGGAEKERRPPVLPRRPQVDREETPKKGWYLDTKLQAAQQCSCHQSWYARGAWLQPSSYAVAAFLG